MNVTEWIEKVYTLQFEPKILHPDFSLLNQSYIGVAIGVLIFLLLMLRRWFPMLSLCRYTLRTVTGGAVTIHGWHSLLVWSAMLLEGHAQEQRAILTLGINVFLFMQNRTMLYSCDRLLRKRVKEELYKQAMHEAITLYGVNEAHCREVVSDTKALRSFLTLVSNELDLKGIHDTEQRILNGKVAFNDLLAKERLHRNLIQSPQLQANLSKWRNHGILSNDDDMFGVD